MRAMLTLPLARWGAFFWGAVVFLPVGANYTAMLLTCVAMGMQGKLDQRARRIRASPYWWPGLVFTTWVLLVLAFQPIFYPETPSNLFHALRIILTLAVVAALDRDETRWALRGLLAGALASLCVIAIHRVVGLPPMDIWMGLIRHQGNKSVSNALLFALLAVAAFVISVECHHRRQKLVWWAFGIACASPVLFVLPSRTAMLAAAGVAVAALLHRRTFVFGRTAAIASACLVFAAVTLSMQPAIVQKYQRGGEELRQARVGAVSTDSSWGIRYHMYRHTTNMMLERPWAGWGIGSWNSEWKKRTQPLLHDLNMPHNDYLWMGAQAGIPGLLVMCALVFAGLPMCWRRRDMAGRLGLVAILTLGAAAAFNSALRDAAIGLSLLFVVGLFVNRAASPAKPVQPSPRAPGP